MKGLQAAWAWGQGGVGFPPVRESGELGARLGMGDGVGWRYPQRGGMGSQGPGCAGRVFISPTVCQNSCARLLET